jgi:N-acetylmuramoyl-L-alanine amidase
MNLNFKKIFSFLLFSLILHSIYSQENSKFKVVLDAGHGGKDSGAVNRILGLKEKDIALEVCLRVQKLLSKTNEIEVFLTRKSDYFIPVYQRAEIANKQKANLFLSVHLNSAENTAPYGTETFVMGLSKSKSNLEVAKKENSVITLEKDYKTKYEGFDPNSPESLIGLTLLQEQYLNQSISLASKLQKKYTIDLERYNRGVKQDVFLVLHKAAMPSVLTEIGFLSNDEEAKFMNSEEGKDKLAQAVANAILDYKKEYFKDNVEQDKTIDYNDIEISEIVKDDKNKVDKIKKEIINKKQVEFKPIEKNKDTTKAIEPKIIEPIVIEPKLNENEIIFKVQIRSSVVKLKLNESAFKGYKNVTYFQENGSYKYYYFESNSLKESKQKLIEARNFGFKDAFIVGFKEGKRINIDQLK